MNIHKRKPVLPTTWVVLVLCAFFLSCDLLDNAYDGPPINVLSKKDSLAVRAILDANGLDTVKVMDVIELQYPFILHINLDSVPLQTFIFCKYFDSLESGLELNLIHNNVDTLIFPETLHRGLSINLVYTKVRAIPDGIANLRGAVSLNFDNNEISSISPNIMQCDIYSLGPPNYNKLCNIPDSISQWITKTCRDSTWRTKQTCP